MKEKTRDCRNGRYRSKRVRANEGGTNENTANGVDSYRCSTLETKVPIWEPTQERASPMPEAPRANEGSRYQDKNKRS